MEEWKPITELTIINAPPLPIEKQEIIKPDNKGFIVHSSQKSLFSKYSIVIILESIMLFLGIIFVILFNNFLLFILSIFIFAFIFLFLIKDIIIINNTKYYIYPDHIKSESYLFKFLGVDSRTINLKLIKYIEAYSNNYLDVLFFNCGKIIITVSGDIPDLELINIEKPMGVKNRIEKMLFGSIEVIEGNPSMKPS